MFPGDKLYELKATHGVPLDISIYEVMTLHGLSVSWCNFIDQARKNKVWDFQIVAMIETGLTDAGISKETIDEIISRAKLYIMKTLETQS